MGLMNPDEGGGGGQPGAMPQEDTSAQARIMQSLAPSGAPSPTQSSTTPAPLPSSLPPTPTPSYFPPSGPTLGPTMSDPGQGVPLQPAASPLSTPAPQPNQSVSGLGGQTGSLPMISALLGQGGMQGQQNPISAGGFGTMKGFG